MHQAVKYLLDQSAITRDMTNKHHLVFTVNKVNLQNLQIQLRFRSTQSWSSSPKNVLLLYFILLHDINYIIALLLRAHTREELGTQRQGCNSN